MRRQLTATENPPAATLVGCYIIIFPNSFSKSSSDGIFRMAGDFLEWLNGLPRFDKKGGMSGLMLAGWRELVRKPAGNRRSDRRGWGVIGTQKLLRKSRGHFVSSQSARGLAQSKTLRVFQASSCRAQRLGVRRPSAAFPRGISNGTKVNWNCYLTENVLDQIKGYL